MEWEEIAPGHWCRQLDGIESFFHSMSSVATPTGIAHAMVSVGATLPKEVDCSIASLQKAWKSLRYHHPRIASAARNGNLYYKVPDDSEMAEWLSKTLIIDHCAVSSLDVLATLKSSETGVLVFLPRTREIFFQISHDHIDGVGAIMFLPLLLSALKNPSADVTFGDEYTNLSDSLSHVLDQNPSSPPSELQAKGAHSLAQHFESTPSSLSLGSKAAPRSSFAVRLKRLEFSPAETDQVRKRAHCHGITVTHACHSSVIQALYHLSDGATGTYKSLIFVSLRRRLRQRSGHEQSPVSVHMSAIPVVLPACWRGFGPLAQSLKYVYTKCSGERHQAAWHKSMYPLLSQALESAGDPQVQVSSLGVVDDHLGHDVDDFWVGGGSATADLTTYVWTFKGRLTLAVWYNDAFYEEAVVELFLQTAKSMLVAGLGLSTGAAVEGGSREL